MTVLIAWCVTCLCIMSVQSVSYSGYKVVRVVPTTDKQLEVLQDLYQKQRGHRDYDFWKPPSRLGAPVDINLSPDTFDGMVTELKGHGMTPNTTIHDVEKLTVLQKLSAPDKPARKLFDYGKYHRLREIEKWMLNLTRFYPDKVSLLHIAVSYEGRSIKGLKISTNNVTDKPAFWMEGAIHSREWVSPATVMYMTGQMLDTYDTDPNVKAVVDMYYWYILPVFNVDGYEYTWTEDRMWRKTRSAQAMDCKGTDPNRNWDMQWCKVGASKNPCSDIYCGPRPFSEVETLAVSNFLQQIPNLRVFIDFHAYSQLWMTNWGYTENVPVEYCDLFATGKICVAALKEKYGTEYRVGSITNIIYAASGGTIDWVFKALKTRYSYGVELRDTGEYGFLLPQSQIIPSGIETFEAVKTLAKHAIN